MSADLHEQISKAIAAHGQWKLRLAEAIRSGKSEFSPAVVAKDDQCPFGTWLYGPGAGLAGTPEYQDVKKLHADFHRDAAEVLQLAVTGKNVEADAAMGNAGRFSAVSSSLVLAMMRWQKEAA